MTCLTLLKGTEVVFGSRKWQFTVKNNENLLCVFLYTTDKSVGDGQIFTKRFIKVLRIITIHIPIKGSWDKDLTDTCLGRFDLVLSHSFVYRWRKSCHLKLIRGFIDGSPNFDFDTRNRNFSFSFLKLKITDVLRWFRSQMDP